MKYKDKTLVLALLLLTGCGYSRAPFKIFNKTVKMTHNITHNIFPKTKSLILLSVRGEDADATKSIQKLIKNILENNGYKVTTCENAYINSQIDESKKYRIKVKLIKIGCWFKEDEIAQIAYVNPNEASKLLSELSIVRTNAANSNVNRHSYSNSLDTDLRSSNYSMNDEKTNVYSGYASMSSARLLQYADYIIVAEVEFIDSSDKIQKTRIMVGVDWALNSIAGIFASWPYAESRKILIARISNEIADIF